MSEADRQYLELCAERRRPVPHITPEDRDLDDLRHIIHILAMALTDGKAVA